MQLRKISEQAETSAVTLEQLREITDFLLWEAQQEIAEGPRPHLYWEGFEPHGAAVCLADIIIEICAYCAQYNIDLEWAIKMSLDYRRSKQGE